MHPILDTKQLETHFSATMERLGPFEKDPKFAVAVSGGSDSLCLSILLKKWVLENGGTVVGLTVDHQLRPHSFQEAKMVERWIESYQIPHYILTWSGKKPQSGIQKNARNARYNLLEEWCKKHNILHLFLGHNMEDQGETSLFRLLHKSGPDGLAGMTWISEKKHVRIIRPLLNVSRETLKQKLKDSNQEWIDDPSNRSLLYTRTHLRSLLKNKQSSDLSHPLMHGIAYRQGLGRVALESETYRFLARSTQLFPEGYLLLDSEKIKSAPKDIALRSLSWILTSIGDQVYPPRLRKLENLHKHLISANNQARTCCGCKINKQRKSIIFLREWARIKHKLSPQGKGDSRWDQRFIVSWPQVLEDQSGIFYIARLGKKGWQQIVGDLRHSKRYRVPAEVAYTLPAIWKDEEVQIVPSLGYTVFAENQGNLEQNWAFAPLRSFGPPIFMIA